MSLAIFVIVYLVIFSFGTLYVYRLLRAGPIKSDHAAPANPKRPLAVADGRFVPKIAQEGNWT
jgi:cytochrome d ubiquinol oxidase subunit I